MDYLSLNFLLYLGRWLLSAIIMFAPLYVLVKLQCCSNSRYAEYIHLVLIQIVGAFIFYKIDQFIFKG